jgi:YfiH family protein
LFHEKNIGGLRYLTSDKISMKHGFTTRLGGVSTGIFSSLNLGEHRGDKNENVRENYRLAGEALGIDHTRLVFSKQVHGNAVRIVTAADAHTLFTPVAYEADGRVTNSPDVPLIVFTADCVPVLLADQAHGVIAAVHCGWRSTVGDILGNAVDIMKTLGAEPNKIRAAIGPAIGACCFECGGEVPDALRNWLGSGAEEFIRDTPVGGKLLVDLRGANRQRLVSLGLSPGNIDVSSRCTKCESETFWSHRETRGERGSQAAIISL